MADAARVAGKSQLILMLSQRVRVGTPDTPFRSLPKESSLMLMVSLAMISKNFDSSSLDHRLGLNLEPLGRCLYAPYLQHLDRA